jgi:hypothetical protein
MIRQELNKRSPLRILENTTHGGLGKRNIGIFAAYHGEGKTACLVHFALDALLQNQTVLHITFSEVPDHIYSWYENIFSELAKGYRLEKASEVHDEISQHRMIMNFNLKKLSLEKAREKISQNLKDLKFKPEVIIVDGFEAEHADENVFGEFKAMAQEHEAELWFSYAVHDGPPSGARVNLTETLAKLDGVISVIIFLEFLNHKLMLRLLRDHERACIEDTHLRLDPTTLLIMER